MLNKNTYVYMHELGNYIFFNNKKHIFWFFIYIYTCALEIKKLNQNYIKMNMEQLIESLLFVKDTNMLVEVEKKWFEQKV